MTLSISMGAIVAQRPGRAPIALAQHRHTAADTFYALAGRIGELKAQAVVAGLIRLEGK